MRTFSAYLASTFLSALGNAAAGVALPLTILLATGDAMATGYVAAATAVPTIAVGLLAGVMVDRLNRRDVAVVSDVLSAIAVAAVPLVDGAVGLSLGWFIGLGIAGAVGDAPGSAAREAMAPAVAARAHVGVDRLLGAAQGAGALAMVVGPACAGAVATALDPATALWITAGASALASLAGLGVPRDAGGGLPQVVPEQARNAAESGSGRSSRVWSGLGSSIREGWVVLTSQRALIWVTALSGAAIMITAALQALLLPSYGLQMGRPGLGGTALAIFAGGVIAGALGYSVLADGRRRRWWFVGGAAGVLAALLVIAPFSSTTSVLVGAGMMGLAAGPLNSSIAAALVDLTPDAARGRVLSLQNAFMLAAAPLGVLATGLLVETGGLSAAGWAFVALWGVATVLAATLPSLRRLDAVEGGDGATAPLLEPAV